MIDLGPSNQAGARGGRPRRDAPLIDAGAVIVDCPAPDCDRFVVHVWSRDPVPPRHRLGHRVLECVCGATWLGAEWIYASGAGDCYRGEVAP